MKKYLLLRDNKQSGPHTYEEMLGLGFKKYDLVWVEGKSAAWRYPGELPEFAPYAPLVEEQPYDRFYKKPAANKPANDFVANSASEKPAQAIKDEPYLPKSPDTTEKQTEKKFRRVAISLPGNKVPEPKRTITPKKTERPLSPDLNTIGKESGVALPPEPKATSGEKEAGTAVFNFSPESDTAQINPGALLNSVASQHVKGGSVPLQSAITETGTFTVPPASRGESRPTVQWLQYSGIAVALISLVMIGVLIGMGIGNTDPAVPKPLTVESPKVTELREKLAMQEAVSGENVQAETESPATADPMPEKPRAVEVQKTQAVIREDIPRNIEESKSPAEENGERNSVRRTDSQEPVHTADIADNVEVELNDYKVNVFGGIEDIKVTVRNNNPVPISEILVELRYILSNRKANTESIRFVDIKPGESVTHAAPSSNRGIKLETRILEVRK